MPRLFAVQLKDEPAERYEAWVNTPVYTHDYEDCVGWLGCELPEDGHSCEFAELAGDGAVVCTSSSTVNRLRDENAKLRALARDMFEEIEDSGFDPLVERQGKRGHYYEEDPSWRVGIRERVRELGLKVDDE